MIFDRELQQQRTIPAADMGDVYDVAEMRNSDVVVATENGLYHSSYGEWHSPSTFAKIALELNKSICDLLHTETSLLIKLPSQG